VNLKTRKPTLDQAGISAQQHCTETSCCLAAVSVPEPEILTLSARLCSLQVALHCYAWYWNWNSCHIAPSCWKGMFSSCLKGGAEMLCLSFLDVQCKII